MERVPAGPLHGYPLAELESAEQAVAGNPSGAVLLDVRGEVPEALLPLCDLGVQCPPGKLLQAATPIFDEMRRVDAALRIVLDL